MWPGFPGQRTRSPAESRNVNESCVARLLFFGVGGSGRRPSRIRRPRGGARGGWVGRDVEKRARIVVDGVVKDVDTGGGWGTRRVIFFPLGGIFPCIFSGPRASEAGRGATAPGVAPVDGFRRLPASGPIKMQGSGHLRARGPVKLQGSGHPPRDGLGRSGRRARKNAGI